MRRSRVEVPYIDGAEQDVFTGWRDLLCYLARPGRCSEVKRRYRRRVRRITKHRLREENL